MSKVDAHLRSAVAYERGMSARGKRAREKAFALASKARRGRTASSALGKATIGKSRSRKKNV